MTKKVLCKVVILYGLSPSVLFCVAWEKRKEEREREIPVYDYVPKNGNDDLVMLHADKYG